MDWPEPQVVLRQDQTYHHADYDIAYDDIDKLFADFTADHCLSPLSGIKIEANDLDDRPVQFQRSVEKTSPFGYFENTCSKIEQPVPVAPNSHSDDLVQQVLHDMQATCRRLNISPDPMNWTPDQVCSWLADACHRQNLPTAVAENFIGISGQRLCMMDRCGFSGLAGSAAECLQACFDMWVSALDYSTNSSQVHPDNDWQTAALPRCSNSVTATVDEHNHDLFGSSQHNHNFGSTFLPPIEQQQSANSPASIDSGILVDHPAYVHVDEIVQRHSVTVLPADHKPRTGHNHYIHLWQFIRQLLDDPDRNNECVRWISKQHGIFKIESSTDLARLWGERKNRPLMNYDKLSRSLRQYYRKGILRKTPRSQRLIYQFCPPYNQ